MRKLNKYILGIHDGHNCGASIVESGRVIASICEERLTRNKNEVGYPTKSIEECLKIAKIDSKDLSEVVYASNFMHAPEHLKKIDSWYLVGKTEQDQDEKLQGRYQ